ncbi:MAG: efflux RND transporter periplasmic adaptor subunit [Candidatus Zixiibacteriota bacterium]
MEEKNAENADLSGLKINRDSKKTRSGGKKKWLNFFWILIPAVLYFGYQYTLKEVAPAKKVNIDTVRYLSGPEANIDLVATGYVVAQIKASVSSKATGRLISLNVEEGDMVRKGNVIARLENDDITANLDLFKAYLRQYQADSIEAHLHYNRQKKLLDAGFATQEVFDQATAGFQKAIANVQAGNAQIRAAEVALENTIIRAPFDGTVLTKDADVGEMVAPLAASASSRGAVVTIADMSSLEVEADVSESNIQKVVPGQPCEIILDAYPSIKYSGFVKKIVPTADRSRATVMVKIAFREKNDGVLPEMSARVNFLPVEEHEAEDLIQVLVVKRNAIAQREGKDVIFVCDGEYARIARVEPGKEMGELTEIISGVSAGMKVILNPPGGLKDGDKVEISN